MSLRIKACSHAASRLAKSLGAAPGRQVRHAARTGRFLERPGLSVTLGRRCVCVSTSERQLPSACRSTGVYSSSLLLLASAPFPVAPRPPDRARRGTRARQRHATRAPDFCFCSKINPLLITAAVIFTVWFCSSLNTGFYLRTYMLELRVEMMW